MKLTNNRFYFDFNATSPLAQAVKDWLSRGDFAFANPSSTHSSGKAARRQVKQTSEFLYDTFEMPENEYHLFYHSGASEAINAIIKGFAEKKKGEGSAIHFFYSRTDHSCSVNQVPQLESLGHHTHELEVDSNGELDWVKAERQIKSCDGVALVNLTWVNNETGVVWPLEKIRELKSKTGAWVHVDAVQSVGKIADWQRSLQGLDALTYSGHKFGALKGIGFSFIHRDFAFEPFIVGGGQQMGLRAGTINNMGITSLKLALEELKTRFDHQELKKNKLQIEKALLECMGSQGQIFAHQAHMRNANTICFGLYETRADILATAFDLAGVDVSTGPACSSGSVNPSRVLLAMGEDEQSAKSVIRLSFSPYLKSEQCEEFIQKILDVVGRFLS